MNIFKRITKNISEYFKKKKIKDKLKWIVRERQSFEEESLQYEYTGPDKDEIFSVMEYFYEHLSDFEFYNKYVWYDDKDEFENYHIWVKYKYWYTEVYILYGQGSTCIIHPINVSPDTHGKSIFEIKD